MAFYANGCKKTVFFKISQIHFLIFGKGNASYVLYCIEKCDNMRNFAICAIYLLRNHKIGGTCSTNGSCRIHKTLV